MKHLKSLLAIFIGCLLLISSGCGTQPTDIPVDSSDVDELKSYKIDVTFNPDEKMLKCSQSVQFANETGNELNEIYFHVYPNAYDSIFTLPFTMDMTNTVYWKGFEPGNLVMESIKVDGEDASFSIHDEITTIMELDLNETLQPGEIITIEMDYAVNIPPSADRLGYGENTFNFGNWYPILVEYDNSGWHLDPYYNIGDPFFSSVSDYAVNITAPKDYIIAHSGTLRSKLNTSEGVLWEITADNMRDFAWLASDKFIVSTQEINGVKVKSYFLNSDPVVTGFSENYTLDALNTFSNLYGAYPYTDLSVVQCDFFTGMEYPGLIMMDKKYYHIRNLSALERVLVHEVAHQWWYGVVGNNEIDDAWLDEGLTTFSTGQYYKYNYGHDKYEEYVNKRLKNLERKWPELAQQGFVKSVSEYTDFYKYALLNYRNGMLYFYDLEQKYSEEKLLEFLGAYYEANKFKVSTPEKFLDLGEEIFGDGFMDVSNRWLYGIHQ